jgi:hypothetical protein
MSDVQITTGRVAGRAARRELSLAVDEMYCGCGTPGEALKTIHDLLRAAPFHENRAAVEAILPTSGVEMLVLGSLDRADLIEHGSSIAGSWLTEKGQRVLSILDQVSAAEGYDAFTDADRCAHGHLVDETFDCAECNPSEADEASGEANG